MTQISIDESEESGLGKGQIPSDELPDFENPPETFGGIRNSVQPKKADPKPKAKPQIVKPEIQIQQVEPEKPKPTQSKKFKLKEQIDNQPL